MELEDGYLLPLQTKAEFEYMLREMITKKIPATLTLLDCPEICYLEKKDMSPPGNDGVVMPVERIRIPCHVFNLKVGTWDSEKRSIYFIARILEMTSIVMCLFSGDQLTKEEISSIWSDVCYGDARDFYEAHKLKETPARAIAISLDHDERKELITISLHLYSF